MGRTEPVAQTFMLLCFMAAGLLLSVQIFPQGSELSAQRLDEEPGRSRSLASLLPFNGSSSQEESVTEPARFLVSSWPEATDKAQQLLEVSAQQADLVPVPDAVVPQARMRSHPVSTLSDMDDAAPPGSSASSTVLQPGVGAALPLMRAATQSLKAEAQVNLVVDLSDRTLSLYQGDDYQTSFPIAVGRAGWETPTGEFQVLEKQVDPTWRHPFNGELVPPGPDNPLGSRWIGFWTNGTHQIGFHGTNEAEFIGKAVSHGCIRMHEKDIQTLYSLVDVGTLVTVKP